MSRARWALSKTTVASARPVAFRVCVPLKMTSFISSPRRPLADCSPKIHLKASTTFDFPQPFGPTMAVTLWGKVNSVLSANDLKPRTSSFFRYIRRNPLLLSSLPLDHDPLDHGPSV